MPLGIGHLPRPASVEAARLSDSLSLGHAETGAGTFETVHYYYAASKSFHQSLVHWPICGGDMVPIIFPFKRNLFRNHVQLVILEISGKILEPLAFGKRKFVFTCGGKSAFPGASNWVLSFPAQKVKIPYTPMRQIVSKLWAGISANALMLVARFASNNAQLPRVNKDTVK
ncbi:hypothetical protein LSM04_004249 [Trypanosoma melophagium]|uniref:uncharacterized protein n=1 Tax=Trypanosoma melophagium TaxID=715481 RepID=UPI00351AAD30|nr:hypothetical protein LSM04_004249 [Trypanosoma melophagium]